ncbi:MAG: fimbrillin family protein [Bacteroides sp.]|nr:fimbrillin family protein [Bacteroides sp.]MBQ8602742.1 fimbrillin family protein [Bacteroides sp.]
MKKYLFIALAASAMVSCSQDETLDNVQGEAIKFGPTFVENSTRAAANPSYVMNTKDITQVDVWGTVTAAPTGSTPVLIYSSTDVTKGSAAYGAVWTCPVTQYWVPGATYKFVGIVDGEKTGVTTANIPEGELLPTTVTYVADGETDLLCDVVDVAGTNVTATYNEIVKFSYTHLLSKVKFTLTDNSPADASGVKTHFRYSVSDIKITNAYAQGTVTVADGKWNNLSTAKAEGQTDNYCTFGDIAWNDEDKECAAEKLLLPMSNPTVSFKLKLEGKDANDKWVTISEETKTPSATIALEAAKAYNFNIEVTVGQQIQFSVQTLTAWTDATPQPDAFEF